LWGNHPQSMKSFLWCLLTCSTFPILVLAQNGFPEAKLKLGPLVKGLPGGSIASCLSKDQSGYYLVGQGEGGSAIDMGSDPYLQKILPTLNLGPIYDQVDEPKDEESGKRYKVEHMTRLGDNLYTILSVYRRKEDRDLVFARSLDSKTLKPSTKNIPLTEEVHEGRKDRKNYIFKSSSDGLHMAMIIDMARPEKDEKVTFKVGVFDQNMNAEWKGNISLPYTNREIGDPLFRIDNNGNIYVTTKIYIDGEREVRKGAPNYKWHIFLFSNKGQKMTDHEIKLDGGLFVNSFSFGVGGNDEIVLAGLYSKENILNADGSFFQRMDMYSGSVKAFNTQEFDVEFLAQGLSDKAKARMARREAKGKEYELSNYDLRDLVYLPDGSALLTGEQYYVVVYTTTINGHTTTNYEYNYRNIIAVRIAKDGRILYSTYVPKMQVSTNDRGPHSSFSTFVGSKSVYFLYNDHKANSDKPDYNLNNFTISNRNGVVMMAKMDLATGKIQRKHLISMEDLEVAYRPKSSEQIDDKTFLFSCEEGKKEQYGIITFSE